MLMGLLQPWCVGASLLCSCHAWHSWGCGLCLLAGRWQLTDSVTIRVTLAMTQFLCVCSFLSQEVCQPEGSFAQTPWVRNLTLCWAMFILNLRATESSVSQGSPPTLGNTGALQAGEGGSSPGLPGSSVVLLGSPSNAKWFFYLVLNSEANL